MYQKHLLQCTCVLPQFRKSKTPTFHKFIAFSIIDDADVVVSTYVKCPNCGAIHKVLDISKSIISYNKDDLKSVVSIEDVSVSIPDKIKDVLESHVVDLSTWQEVKHIVENKLWGSIVVLTSEDIGGCVAGKYLKILGVDFLKIDTHILSRQ